MTNGSGARGVLGYLTYPLKRILSRTPRRDRFLDEKYVRVREHYGATCLDVGSGHGDFAVFLASQGVAVTAIDIVDSSRHEAIRPRLFDGVTIPFPDDAFDTGIAMFVLHHAADQVRLLQELGRVVRRRIIIAEDVTENSIDRILGSIHLWSSVWGKSREAFHSDAEWRSLFQRLGWRLVDELAIPRSKRPSYPINRRIYVLEPPPRAGETG